MARMKGARMMRWIGARIARSTGWGGYIATPSERREHDANDGLPSGMAVLAKKVVSIGSYTAGEGRRLTGKA